MRAVDSNGMLREIDLDSSGSIDRLNRLRDGADAMATGHVGDLERVHGELLVEQCMQSEPCPHGKVKRCGCKA